MATLGPFSKRTYVVPFGRYVGATEVEPPADEVLVGREGQRAFLIDLLISTGRRGAYLVTGRRGTGKTSFVKHCIAEYEASVFSRFLRANVGRGFWDRAFVVLFWSALLLGALMMSELLQLLTSKRSEDPLAWIAFAPIGILFLYPCVYAKVVLETIFRSFRQRVKYRDTTIPGIAATLVTLCLTAVAWFFNGLANPPTVSILIPVLCGCYFFAQAISFENDPNTSSLNSGPFAIHYKWRWIARLDDRLMPFGWYILFRRYAWQIVLNILLLLYLSLIWMVALSPKEPAAAAAVVQAHIGQGLSLLGVAYALRGWYQRDNSRLVRRTASPLRTDIADAMKTGARWYLAAGFSVSVFGVYTWWQIANFLDSSSERSFLLATFLLVLAFLFRRHLHGQSHSSDSPKFRPQPTWVLFTKVVISIVIALQLAYPILASIPLRRIYPPLSNLPTSICSDNALCKAAGYLNNSPSKPIFEDRDHELLWLLSVILLLVFLHLLEYEWLVRPSLRSREDRTFDPSGTAPWDDREPDATGTHNRCMRNGLAELTIPWIVYKIWLPVLPVSVNLGFDRLDHRHVIQAMLVGLRERYYRTFLAWNSGFANLGRFIGAFFLLTIVTLVSSRTGASLREHLSHKWFDPLNANLLPRLESSHDTMIVELMPSDVEGVLHFHLYDLLLLLCFFIVSRWLLYKIPLLPYKENLRRIDDLLDSLSARTRVTSGFNMWGPARWVYSIFVDERVRETEWDPVDPRTVELAFLQILEDAQKGGFRFPGAAKLHLTMPAPEITFIFDELDKLGTRVDPDLTREPAAQEQETEVLHQERERSVKLRSLLSDLKNIIASAPARFIFVGGRDLHDEWLADQTSRQPLLTSIFHAEVYLPSLLTDHGKHPLPQVRRLHRRAGEYLFFQYRRAQLLHSRSARKRWRPSFGLALESLVYERFIAEETSKDRPIVERLASAIAVIDSKTGELLATEGPALLRDLVLFLTHRSMGNPKRQKDLLSSFIRPAGRELEDAAIRWQASPCRHVLRFSDTEIFRIQLVVNLYRHLTLRFEERMVRRDDKFAISIFFLTDFLFKFHRRAFSWSNLERVDDLAHIHRLPDLRDIQEEIVTHFSERFLHRMLNGLYAFRFRSDIAAELEYLSRQSAAEMAAFNFTLDESQSLKAEYEAALKGKEENNPDLLAALGELYEFDQDFERARYYYRRAIDLLDSDLRQLTSHLDRDEGKYQPGAPIHAILAGNKEGLEDARLFLAWGTARLRLMLQTGMTFEHAREFERSEAEYRNARTLARALVTAYIDEEGRKSLEAKPDSQHANRLHSLKQMNILFQPLFAEAWLSEKFVGAIDTSISLVERGLWDLRSVLPFVRDPVIQKVYDPIHTHHANFALTLSQLHNKAGDIYFFKGNQPVSAQGVREIIKRGREGQILSSNVQPDRSSDGYLLRAHYHYATGLHELRHYIIQRVESSRVRLSLSAEPAETLSATAFPDFLFRAAAGGINDMAEATLARVSLFGLFDELHNQRAPNDLKHLHSNLAIWCEQWFAGVEQENLKNWFGIWTQYIGLDSGIKLVNFEGGDLSTKRLAMSLELCLLGAGYFEKGGYPEDAGRELLQVCETVTRYLWWGHSVRAIFHFGTRLRAGGEQWQKEIKETVEKWTCEKSALPGLVMSDALDENSGEYWNILVNLALEALEKADSLFRESRHGRSKEEDSDQYLVGLPIPPEALTLLCSLRIAGDAYLHPAEIKRLRRVLKRWMGPTNGDADYRQIVDYWEVLRLSLYRHRYPIINRLNGMKVLIDSLVLGREVGNRGFDPLEQALEWTGELLDLNTQYEAPLHFTPLHSGTTCALLWLRWISEGRDQNNPAIERVYRAAQADLQDCGEMHTMRRAYYEAISDLYYLYDDFNDRQIHFNHAIQMAGAELASVLKELVDLREKTERPLSSRPRPAFASGPQSS